MSNGVRVDGIVGKKYAWYRCLLQYLELLYILVRSSSGLVNDWIRSAT